MEIKFCQQPDMILGGIFLDSVSLSPSIFLVIYDFSRNSLSGPTHMTHTQDICRFNRFNNSIRIYSSS